MKGRYMNRYSMLERENGELAMRGLSEKARGYYGGCGQDLIVYEVEQEDGDPLYDVCDCGTYTRGLTFAGVERWFEEMQNHDEELKGENNHE